MIRIKALNPEQWDIFRSIRLNALANTPDAFGSTLDREKKLGESDWRKRLERDDCRTFVAVTKNQLPVGLIVGAPYNEQAGLFAMWVDPNYRRQGIGSALVDAVICWARKRGCSRLFLDVNDDDIAAVGLYRSKGFKKTGVTGTHPPPRDHIEGHQRCLTLK